MKISDPAWRGRFFSWAVNQGLNDEEIQILRRKFRLRGNLKGCNPNVMIGIKAFTLAFTRSHTTRSKRYSVWTLIRENVEPPLSNYLHSYRLQHKLYELRVGAFADTTKFADTWQRCMDELEDFGLTHEMRRDLGNLEDLLRLYLRPTALSQSEKTFQATLESIRYLCKFSQSAVSNRSVGGGIVRGENRKTVRPVFDPIQAPYCELCYRLCQHAELSDSFLSAPGSIRFCREHDPVNPNSQYRTDHNQRREFHAKLQEIYDELPHQQEKWIKLAGDFDEVSIRRYAYQFVHAHPVDDRLKVIQLSNEGHSNVKIAEILGISRQMVHKVLNNPLKSAFGRTALGEIIDMRKYQNSA